LPALASAQRDEAAERGHAGFELPVALLDDPQFLVTSLANGNHQPAVVFQLVQERLRNGWRAGRDRNRVVRRKLRVAERAIAAYRNHILVSSGAR